MTSAETPTPDAAAPAAAPAPTAPAVVPPAPAPAAPAGPAMFDTLAVAEAGQAEYPPFSFLDLERNVQQLPDPRTLPTGKAKRFREVDQADDLELALAGFFADVAPEAWQAIEQLPVFVTEKLMEAMWTQFSPTPDPEDVEGKEDGAPAS